MKPTTVEKIQREHAANRLLQAPMVAQLPSDARDFGVDQPSAPLADGVIDGAVAALEGGQTHYVDVPGILPLREAIVADLAARGLSGYEAASALVTASVQEARFLTLQVLGDASGGVALPDVVHPGARKVLGMRDLAPSWLPTEAERGHLPSVDAVGAAMAAGARLVYLESPSRLSGAAFSADEVARLGALAAEHDAAILWDAGLAGWTDDDASLAALGENAARVTLLGELLPGIGLEAFALGFVATDSDAAPALTSLKQIVSICTATGGQYAALTAADGYADRRTGIRSDLAARRSALVGRLEALGADVLPGAAASHVAVRAGEALGAALHAGGVVAADGAGFGAPGVLRLAVPTDDAALSAFEGGAS